MSEFNLPNAPIREAVIDIRLKTPLGIESLETIKDLHEGLKSDFPEILEFKQFQGEIQFSKKDGPISSATEDRWGYIFKSEDGLQIIQLKRDGMIFSRLRPYISWKEFEPAAKQIWAAYKTVCNSSAVKRIATRFINEIRMNRDNLNLDYYFKNPPKLSDSLNCMFLSIFHKDQVIQTETGHRATIGCSLERAEEKAIVILLDIDVFHEVSLSCSQEDKIWELLNELRTFKNNIFLETLTTEAMEEYK